MCQTSPVAWTDFFFQMSCNQCIIIIIYGECRLNEQPHLTPQCNVMFCELAFTVRRSAALHTRWLCTNAGLRMMFRSVPDQKSAAVKLTTYILAQWAQRTHSCTHIFENKFCITGGSYCVSKALFKFFMLWCSGLLQFQRSYLSYCWFQIFLVL